jgi:hypothetical protein
VEGHARHTASRRVVQREASGRMDGMRLDWQATLLARAGIKPGPREALTAA